MKAFLIALAFVLVSALPAKAAIVSGETHRTVFNCCGTGQGAVIGSWDTAFYLSAAPVTGIEIANSGTTGILVGVGASGAEVSALTIPASSAMTLYPLKMSKGKKIAIKPLTSTGGVGEVDLNLMY